MKRTVIYLLLTFLPWPATGQDKVAPRKIKENFWYKNSIIYNLEIGVFKDSDGDGRGDINGLIQKLDYLKMLGVDVIWLAPFQPSPGADDGYDVADYYGIDPKLGTPGDFAELMHQVKKRGMRVIMDLVINHTSDQHPWFQNARTSKTARYRDWYVWSPAKPRDGNKGMVFPGVQKTVWTLDTTTREYYYHRFYKFQPDLNFMNPEVMQETQRIIGYWLNQGISGFRLDAVPFIIEVPKTGSEKPKLDFSFLNDIRQFTQSRQADAAILGEANVEPKENVNYFGKNGEGIQMMFNFFANQHLFYAFATGDLGPFKKAMEETSQIPQSSQWANFLRNHDEIDLGRLTDSQRRKVYEAMGPDTNMQLYDRGIRRRLAPMMGNDIRRLEMAYSLLFSLPGAPVIRYGEELGMGDDLRLKERLSVRTPMQWNGTKNAGFTDADSAFRPVISTGEYGFEKVNAERQWRDESSLLGRITAIIQMRKACPEVGLGDATILESGSDDVLAIRYDYQNQSLIIVHNFSEQPRKVTLAVPGAGVKLYSLFGSAADVEVGNDRLAVQLPAYGFRWYRAGRLIP
ncbi:alpha-amylase family protein [Dyadobacter fermentans]|uniref:alpha-amylase family protein n=1 Tax=Dyadobacter fermentans TaxID=94254 RepID=UPI001CBBA5C4|nr:alpha-amylase family protein [Dyadobacter fermentans]MBZ1357745.1 alpha-amylase family protein [Dyadobacter fermentans]